MPNYHAEFIMTGPNEEAHFGFKSTSMTKFFKSEAEAEEWFENKVKTLVFKWTQNGEGNLYRHMEDGTNKCIKRFSI